MIESLKSCFEEWVRKEIIDLEDLDEDEVKINGIELHYIIQNPNSYQKFLDTKIDLENATNLFPNEWDKIRVAVEYNYGTECNTVVSFREFMKYAIKLGKIDREYKLYYMLESQYNDVIEKLDKILVDECFGDDKERYYACQTIAKEMKKPTFNVSYTYSRIANVIAEIMQNVIDYSRFQSRVLNLYEENHSEAMYDAATGKYSKLLKNCLRRMNDMAKFGWETITRHNDVWDTEESYDIYIEDGKVIHGTNVKHTKTLYPYKSTKDGWENAYGVKYETFRKGFKEGRYDMK